MPTGDRNVSSRIYRSAADVGANRDVDDEDVDPSAEVARG
jgi:hypothetical protein